MNSRSIVLTIVLAFGAIVSFYLCRLLLSSEEPGNVPYAVIAFVAGGFSLMLLLALMLFDNSLKSNTPAEESNIDKLSNDDLSYYYATAKGLLNCTKVPYLVETQGGHLVVWFFDSSVSQVNSGDFKTKHKLSLADLHAYRKPGTCLNAEEIDLIMDSIDLIRMM